MPLIHSFLSLQVSKIDLLTLLQNLVPAAPCASTDNPVQSLPLSPEARHLQSFASVYTAQFPSLQCLSQRHSHSSRVFWLNSLLPSVFPRLGLCVDQHVHCFDFGLTCISDSERFRSFMCNRTEVSAEDTILTSLQVTTHCRNSDAASHRGST